MKCFSMIFVLILGEINSFAFAVPQRVKRHTPTQGYVPETIIEEVHIKDLSARDIAAIGDVGQYMEVLMTKLTETSKQVEQLTQEMTHLKQSGQGDCGVKISGGLADLKHTFMESEDIGSEYMIVMETVNHSMAAKYCERHGYYLASLETEAENTFIQGFLNLYMWNTQSGSFWLSSTDSGAQGCWHHLYPQISLMTFTNWADSEDAESTRRNSCLVIGSVFGYKWQKRCCSFPYNFICERPIHSHSWENSNLDAQETKKIVNEICGITDGDGGYVVRGGGYANGGYGNNPNGNSWNNVQGGYGNSRNNVGGSYGNSPQVNNGRNNKGYYNKSPSKNMQPGRKTTKKAWVKW